MNMYDKENSNKKNYEIDAKNEEDRENNVIYGRNAVLELMKSERDIEKIFVRRGEREGSVRLIIGKAKEMSIPVIELNSQKLDEMSGNGSHQGVVAIVSSADYVSVNDILTKAKEKNEAPFIVICDGITDPHNLGAVMRSAECCGAHGIILPKRRSSPVTGTVTKASAGAVNHLAIAKVSNIASTIDELKKNGVWIYGAEAGGKAAWDTDMKGAVALVLGSEGDGISRLVKEKCDFIVSIPMYGKVNSFNVSCAAAIILNEAAKQRH